MAAVQGIVRTHFGVIVVSSAPGRGTRARVSFPAHGQLPAPVRPAEAIAFQGPGVVLLVGYQRTVRRTPRMLGGAPGAPVAGAGRLATASGPSGPLCSWAPEAAAPEPGPFGPAAAGDSDESGERGDAVWSGGCCSGCATRVLKVLGQIRIGMIT